MTNREAIKVLRDMEVDTQYAFQLGLKVFGKDYTPEEVADLRKVGEDILEEVKTWLSMIPNTPLQ